MKTFIANACRVLIALWSCRRSCLMLSLCLLLIVSIGFDTPGRAIRMELARLEDYPYHDEAERLRAEGKYGEALQVTEAGLVDLKGPERQRLLEKDRHIRSDRDAWSRRGRDVLRGAITGEGSNPESAGGALALDLFVIGDVRDLVIQSARGIGGEDVDEIVVALSAVGIATTALGPGGDGAVAVAKLMRKAGALNDHLASVLIKQVDRARATGDMSRLRGTLDDMVSVALHLPGNTGRRILSQIDDPADLRRLADYLRQNPRGAFALQVSGDEGLRLVLRGSEDAGRALAMASHKGGRGLALLRRLGPRAFRTHPLQGLLKALYKGNLQTALRSLDRFANILIAFALALGILSALRIRSRVRKTLIEGRSDTAHANVTTAEGG